MRWFRRHPSKPPRPTVPPEPKPEVVDVEPAAESTAPPPEIVEPEPVAEPEVAPAPSPAVPAAEPAATQEPMRHWHLAGREVPVPGARPIGTRHLAERATSSGWHRV